ncbi:hypothetical protein FRC10_010825 [Ceratobasidium sp. 414]|nr:hypothetical protein FRC10_010825 [Ceratobasidium sp. 414]
MLQVDPKNHNQTVGGIQLCKDVILTRIGVSLHGISVPTLGLGSAESMEYGFTIFGDMHIKVPGSVIPLELDFEIEEFGGIVGLEAAVRGDMWKNAFGTGINVAMVWRISSAIVRAKNSHITITIGSATISISEAKALSITVDKLEFDHYTSVNATLELSFTGVLVQAEVDKVVLPGGLGVIVVSAYMEVSFEKQGSGRSTDVALGGKVELDGFSLHAISAGVHLYRTSQSNSLE